MKPCEYECHKCGSTDIHRRFFASGEETHKTSGESENCISTRWVDRSNRYIQPALRDCIVHHCRVCGYYWDTNAIDCTYAPVTVVPSKVEGMHTRQTPDFEVSDALELAVKRPDLVTITANRSAIMRELTKLGKWEGKAVVQDIPGIVAWWNRKAVIS